MACKFAWEVKVHFLNSKPWLTYDEATQTQIEVAFQTFLSDNSQDYVVLNKGIYEGNVLYRVSFSNFTQQNIRTKCLRPIRRRVLPHPQDPVHLYHFVSNGKPQPLGPDNSLLIDHSPGDTCFLHFNTLQPWRYIAVQQKTTIYDSYTGDLYPLHRDGPHTCQSIGVVCLSGCSSSFAPLPSSSPSSKKISTTTASKLRSPACNGVENYNKLEEHPLTFPMHITPLPRKAGADLFPSTLTSQDKLHALDIEFKPLSSDPHNCPICIANLCPTYESKTIPYSDDDQYDYDDDEKDVSQAIEMPCGHAFHIDCICHCIKGHSLKCPVCPAVYGQSPLGPMPEYVPFILFFHIQFVRYFV